MCEYNQELRMRYWEVERPARFINLTETLLWNCRLDGKPYDRSPVILRCPLGVVSKLVTRPIGEDAAAIKQRHAAARTTGWTKEPGAFSAQSDIVKK